MMMELCYEESGKSKLRNSDNGGKLVLRKYEDLRRRKYSRTMRARAGQAHSGHNVVKSAWSWTILSPAAAAAALGLRAAGPILFVFFSFLSYYVVYR